MHSTHKGIRRTFQSMSTTYVVWVEQVTEGVPQYKKVEMLMHRTFDCLTSQSGADKSEVFLKRLT